ncbi:GIY-YIG nuclease family protein [Rhodohalobacter barkolensis]|uniref:GIY-YIG domain-containing protein n=1 Tax=Rhodohalobacter barkolensis TaxID=2053187 RepID=A0A2N0VK99_9BACT|nr:GIY-YIG nuclease family protein [Rhodohalobacter barkolensis]PKD44615.1 hypothetical protein CWD77_03900 [Rhodohalobacter barkolensis]
MKCYYTYIITNRKSGTIYTGMTNDLAVRIYQHKQKLVPGFSKKYNLNKLVWFEEHRTPQDAIDREKQIKGWKRYKKIALIEEMNPQWMDLYKGLF